jgi:hypothetical protein
MTAHATIRRAIADLLAASTAIKNFCVSNYALGCAVQLEAFGFDGMPGQADAPFLFVYSDGENESAGEISEATFEVILVAGCISLAAEGALDEVIISTRSAAANGLTVRNGTANPEALLGLALAAIGPARVGAVFRKASVTSSSTVDHPLHWAKARISYYEPNTF